MNKATLLAEIKQLSPEERLDLIDEVWGTLEQPDLAVSPTEEQIAEAQRRLEEHRRDPSSSIPADEVIARLRARFR